MLLKTSSMSYKKYRTATLGAAKSLDPTTCNLFNKTKAAWDAISVPAQSADPTCTPSGQNDDFSLALNPAAGTVQQGGSVTTSVATNTTTGSAQQVTLSATGLPAGVTATFNPATVQSGQSSTLTLSANSSAAPGASTVVVKGQGPSLAHTVDYTLNVGGTQPGNDPPNISVANVQAHLTQFNTIASQNGGNRRAGSAGYTQSLAYVKGRLQAAGFTVTEQNCTSCTYPSNNLIADWPGGPADQTVMFGAHLDGVSAGPGINDNGSGSATLLENALVLAQKNPTMTKHVRFAWWTDEEQGLNGSEFYVGGSAAPSAPPSRPTTTSTWWAPPTAATSSTTSTPPRPPPQGLLDLAEPRPRGERRGPGPQRRLLLPAGRDPHLRLRGRRQRPQDLRPGHQVGRHRELRVRLLLPQRL